jgi:hypothetical protein
MDTIYFDYFIFLTDASTCAIAQNAAATLGWLEIAPTTAATTYGAPITNSFTGSAIWLNTYRGTGSCGLTTAVESVTIPANFTVDYQGNLVAFAGAAAKTLKWRAFPLRRGATIGTKEALQTVRWIAGFEYPHNGDGNTISGVVGTQDGRRNSRHASRTAEGMGYAIRSTVSSTDGYTMAAPASTQSSWERLYVRVRTYPTADEEFWSCKGSGQVGQAAIIMITPQGQLKVYNKGNQAFPGTLMYQGGTLPKNIWAKIDIIEVFASAAAPVGSLLVYLNGVLIGTSPTSAGAGGIISTSQTHSSSTLGNESTTNGLEMDIDDWSNRSVPTLFTGDDWKYGTHIQPIPLTGTDTDHDGTWTGDWRTLDGIPPVNQSDQLTSVTSGNSIAVTTNYVDRQIGCSAIRVSMFCKTGAGVATTLGYRLNGGTPVMSAITSTTGTWATVFASLAGGLQAPNAITALGLKYTRDAAVTSQSINTLSLSAEYIGMWGLEDVPAGDPATAFAPRIGPHNAPFEDGSTTPVARPLGIVQTFSGTYVGNGTGQDITLNGPPYWVWIRPLTGSTGGARWWSSCLSGHDESHERNSKSMLVRAFKNSDTYGFRVSGADANTNANGVTYRYTAFSDPAMRYLSNGSYSTLSATATFNLPLFDSTFTPEAAFLLPEIPTTAATAGFYYKGPGNAATAATETTAGESATVCAFSQGVLTPKAVLNLTGFQTAFSLWRTTDGGTVTGYPVAITSYTGNGAGGTRNIPLTLGGRTPLFALVCPHNGVAYVKDISHSSTGSTPINSVTETTTGITAGTADQITVGTTLNTNLIVYDVFVIAGAIGSGWSGPGPHTPVDPTMPTAWDPTSNNGWWFSQANFSGAADIITYPPTNPHDARDWQKINLYATGAAGYLGGSPGPGVTVDNFFYYAGNDYTVGSSQPTIRVFDGESDRLVINIPDVAGVKTVAIMSMLAVGTVIYLTTMDSGTSNSTFTGRVFSFDPISGTLTQLGTQFTGGEVPYSLCWHMNRLFMGTNKTSGAGGKIYWFRPGIDTAWTTDYTLATSTVGGCLSLASYQGQLYVGSDCPNAAFAKVLVRDTTGAYTTSLTASSGAAKLNNGFPSMYVYNNSLYAAYWNPDATAVSLIYKLSNGIWTVSYTGASGTLRPFIGIWESQNKLFALAGGDALSAALVYTPDGSTWTDLSSFLIGSTTLTTALPIVGKIAT